MTGWTERRTQHDAVALPLVAAVFARHGFDSYRWGAESTAPGWHAALQRQQDRTSLLLRFRPDCALLRPGWRSVLCEIKSEDGRHENFALELDSWLAAREWNAVYPHAMFAFVDLGAGTVAGCWANALPPPTVIWVPRRWDFDDQWQRVAAAFPTLRRCACAHRAGSGTPYYLLPKRLPALRALDEFITVELGPGGAIR